MNTLQFIDSMTGRLAWPLAAVTLGVIFRRSVGQLLGRVRRLKWREGEAELADLAEARNDVQTAIDDVAKPLPEEESERTATYRSRIQRLVDEAVEFGQKVGPSTNARLWIDWESDPPRIFVEAERSEEILLQEIQHHERVARRTSDPELAREAQENALMLRDLLENLLRIKRTALHGDIDVSDSSTKSKRP